MVELHVTYTNGIQNDLSHELQTRFKKHHDWHTQTGGNFSCPSQFYKQLGRNQMYGARMRV